jgi:hypothetical protein
LMPSHKSIYNIILAITSLLLVAFLWRMPIILTSILLVLSFLMILLTPQKETIYLYIIAGLCGALAEAFAVWFGAWDYTNPNIIGIPYWLPVLWGIAALFVRNIYLSIQKRTTKHR